MPAPLVPPRPQAAADVRPVFNRLSARLFFAAGALISAANGLVYLFWPHSLSALERIGPVGSCLVLAAIYVWAAISLATRSLSSMVACVAWASAGVTLLCAALTDQGLQLPSLGYLGLLVCLTTVLSRPQAGLALGVSSALGVGLLGLGQHLGWMPQPLSPLHLLMHLLVIAAAFVIGALIARLVRLALEEAEEREVRFRGLLGIAADVYWELDKDLRFVPLSDDFAAHRRGRPGSRPWDLELGLNEADREAGRRTLEAHLPFTDLRTRHCDAEGLWRDFVTSARPRFDANGQFLGYWGVAKEITSTLRAEQAAQVSESRYHELFRRTPTPLLLHRGGQIVDANDAAAAMFGRPSAQSLVGAAVLALYAPGASRTVQTARLSELSRRPKGSGLEMRDFEMQSADGRRLHAQATDVNVNEADGPAVLSIFHDITARVDAEAALRRSEVMLNQVINTSPDFITLSDLASARYLMVNESFTKLFGYTADETVGRSGVELGIWLDPAEREPLVAAINGSGRIQEMPATFVKKSGEPVALLLSAARFELDGRQYVVVNGRDVTDSQRVQLEHEAMLQNALIGIALTRNGRFVQVNDRFEQMFGWPPGQLVGQPENMVWLHGEGPGDQEPTDQLETERTLRRQDGSTFIGRVLAKPVDSPLPKMGGTIWIAEDITERRQMDQALADARDRAESANRAKSAFLANTSHEIRTPLNGLLGLARLAMQPKLDERRRQQYLSQIHDSAQSLAGIISDILDLSKIEAGKFSIDSVVFDLRALLEAVHHAYQSLAMAHSLQLSLHVDPDLPQSVRGDPLRLRQILSNYITNGVKFTARGQVRIEAIAAREGRIRFSVYDTGPGIDEATQTRLFQPFTQADNSTTRRFGGTGLGLSICKELAGLMGGAIGLDSQVGRGSCFWAELPMPAAELDADGGEDEAQDLVQLAGRHVLLVEDNPVNMLIGVSTLEQWGVDVVQATDGHQAIAAVERAVAERRPFDVVLMDVHMPHLSGHEAARRLRAVHSADALPIVALTAAALVSEREEALEAGMNDFLTKPLDPKKLRQALVRVVVAHSRFGMLDG